MNCEYKMVVVVLNKYILYMWFCVWSFLFVGDVSLFVNPLRSGIINQKKKRKNISQLVKQQILALKYITVRPLI